MSYLRLLKGKIKRGFPKLLSAYHDRKVRRVYTKAYFEASAKECLRLASDIGTTPFLKLQSKMDSDARSHGEKARLESAVIEINNTCNIDCLMCKTSLSTRPKGVISKETLELAVSRTAELGAYDVELHTIGDPLANPRLEDVFKILRKHRVQTGISTNGLLLYRHIKTLTEYRDVCSGLSFSIDGATKETYEKIRAGGNWEQLLDNVRLAREKLAPAGFLLKISMVVSKDNVFEVGRYIELFREYVSHPYANIYFGFVNSLSPDNTYFEKANLFPKHTYINAPCIQVSRPVGHTLIDGRVTVCCRDYDGSLVIGDIRKNTLSEIFSDKPLKDMQDSHKDRFLDPYPLCQTCYIVDTRITDAFCRLMSYLLYHHPEEKASFYQERVDEFVAMFQPGGDPAGLRLLLQ